jgi:catechol 2,3-dioxygenase
MEFIGMDSPERKQAVDEYRLPPDISMGKVSLSVADLSRSLRFYQETVGLELHDQTQREVILGAGNRDLLHLVEFRNASRVRRTTGLYHYALRVPSRYELARTLHRLSEKQANFVGFADHHVSEAIYLADPDGHGIEIYRDRPRDQWLDSQGNFYMTTDPLDLQGLLKELPSTVPSWNGFHPDTDMGHVHLHVSRLPEALEFYLGELGFNLMADWSSAGFISAGGYHHHLGLNTWAGVNAPVPPEFSLRLLSFEIQLPNNAVLAHITMRLEYFGRELTKQNGEFVVEDPSANRIILTSSS